ncbi:ABC transporter ATP-binding protein [Deinococcus deserti]|uniref:Putative ABC transporter, ATP-binding component n=1 Tax=Deinococcus deserti (strain DSM 17065 / CIP 109153 / LMG 22923 / VCD115) TaxID=546414 RepID=C1CZS9_DEIDV|nr:ABC transporter ATP-binding protein [Deinococcus deserti]ACO45181.1 putative ABC transporter, ATP-binding component [Deinococcus deserti VCD115]
MMPVVLQAQDLRTRRGKHTILNDCSMQVVQGSIYALLGPNGTGKSTLLRAFLGLEPVETGRMTVLGIDPSVSPGRVKEQVALVPTGGTLLPTHDAQMHFQVGARLHPEWNAALALETAALFGVPLRCAARHLSTGQRIGLALAYAFASQPRLLVLDEPTNGLDPVHRQALLSRLAEYAADGGTVILTSHVLAEVEGIADHVGFMHSGRVVLEGEMDALRDQYKTVQAIYQEDVPASVAGWLQAHHTPEHVQVDGPVVQIHASGNVDEMIRVLMSAQPLDLQVRPRPLDRLYASVIGGQA